MYQKFYPSLAGNHGISNGLTFMPARHVPARALQWQAGRSRSGEMGGRGTWNDEVLGTKN